MFGRIPEDLWYGRSPTNLIRKSSTTVTCHSDPGDCGLSDNAAGFSTLLGAIQTVCIPPENPRTSQTWMKPKRRKHSQRGSVLPIYPSEVSKNIYYCKYLLKSLKGKKLLQPREKCPHQGL